MSPAIRNLARRWTFLERILAMIKEYDSLELNYLWFGSLFDLRYLHDGGLAERTNGSNLMSVQSGG
jgi:hypothetical protein